MPFCLKSRFAYYSDDINDIVDNTDVWNTENDYPFYESLIKTGLSVSYDYDSAFRFYHMHGAHSPYNLSSDIKYEKNGDKVSRDDQIKGCLKIVYEYIEQLKELGIYDSATIIITADHGKGNANTDTDVTSTSSPIIAVKSPDSQGGIMEISSVPVTQAELISTIAKEAGVDNSRYGKTLEQVTPADNSERYYIEPYADQFQQWTKYIISGNVHDISNWSIAK
jgi:arylsulfatase A-like enzyme